MVRRIMLIGLGLCFGCGTKWQTAAQILDTLLFEHLGGTLLSEPPEVSLKAIHLEAGTIEGRLIITEGNVVERGKNDTFMVVNDDNMRLLIVTTKMDERSMNRFANSQHRVRILGTVDRGQKGIPVMTALSLSDRRISPKKKPNIGSH